MLVLKFIVIFFFGSTEDWTQDTTYARLPFYYWILLLLDPGACGIFKASQILLPSHFQAKFWENEMLFCIIEVVKAKKKKEVVKASLS